MKNLELWLRWLMNVELDSLSSLWQSCSDKFGKAWLGSFRGVFHVQRRPVDRSDHVRDTAGMLKNMITHNNSLDLLFLTNVFGFGGTMLMRQIQQKVGRTWHKQLPSPSDYTHGWGYCACSIDFSRYSVDMSIGHDASMARWTRRYFANSYKTWPWMV